MELTKFCDFITQFIGSEQLIDEKIGEISNDYLKVISAYAEGLNSYAKTLNHFRNSNFSNWITLSLHKKTRIGTIAR